MMMMMLVLAVMQQFADNWGNFVQTNGNKNNEKFIIKSHKHEN